MKRNTSPTKTKDVTNRQTSPLAEATIVPQCRKMLPARGFCVLTLVVASLVVARPMPGNAQSRTNECETVLVFGTGMSAAGIRLSGGAVDPNFQGVSTNFPASSNAVVASTVPAGWLANASSTGSQWIAPASDPSGSAAGMYVYRLAFATPCAGATVTGRFAAATSATVWLNGANTGLATSANGYTNWTALALGGLAAGLNTLEFHVTNSPPVPGRPSPTGLRVELSVVATCCPCIALNCPTNLVVPTCAASAPVVFNVTGTNHCYTNLYIECVPPSGTVMSAGYHTVFCAASDTVGHVTNCTFTVQVGNGAPAIHQQPQGVLAMAEGGSHLLSVVATDPGGCNLYYQWQQDGAALAGATGNTLLLNPLRQTNTGTYSVVVSNFFGAVTSSVAVVRVLPGRDVDGVFGNVWGGSLWYYLPSPGHVFTNQDLVNLHVQVSSNLLDWVTLPDPISVVNGVLEIVDPFGAWSEPQRFYRLLSGDPPAPPPAPLDSTAEVAVSSLPAQTLAVAQQHIAVFIGDPTNRSSAQLDWVDATFAPAARYLCDPGYQGGSVPAYVELRMLGPKGDSDARGYLLLSLTTEDFPVQEFGTRGETKTDLILRRSSGGTVRKFMRFTPGYIVAEDATGRRLGALGTVPLKVLDSLPAMSQYVEASYESDTGAYVPPVPSLLNAVPPANYEDLKADFMNNPARLAFRALRASQAASRWRLATGIRNPVLVLQLEQTLDFLTNQVFTSVAFESPDGPEYARVSVLPGGGFRATGILLGSGLVRGQNPAGQVEHYPLLIKPVGAAAPGITPKANCAEIKSYYWQAGTGWDGDQRQYYQLKKPQWCPDVGCGPTALAMLLGWWDASGVPSAFYRLDSGAGDAHHFRFNFNSLRDADAPKSIYYNDDFALMTGVYDDLYGLCNVMCNPFGDEGGTYPDQMTGALDEYTRRVADHQPSPEHEYGDQLIGVHWRAGYVLPGLGMTDWKGGGTIVAETIQAGYPGIVGLGSTLFDGHYPLAYAYLVEVHKEGCGSDSHVVDIGRFFACNMGWAPVISRNGTTPRTSGSEWRLISGNSRHHPSRSSRIPLPWPL